MGSAAKKIRVDINEVFDNLLKSCSQIISDGFNVTYTDMYGINKICFSPTVYELLKRYEFTR